MNEFRDVSGPLSRTGMLPHEQHHYL